MTIREHLNTLPLPLRERAFRNSVDGRMNIRQNSLKAAMSASFVWARSPEGDAFWRYISNSCKDGVKKPQQWLKKIKEKFDLI